MQHNQHMDVEIQVFGMVEIENKDHLLADALDKPRPEPEYFDIHVKGYPEGFDQDYYLILEIDNVLHPDLLKQLALLQQVFPDAEIERL